MENIFCKMPSMDTLNTTRVIGKNLFHYNTYLTKLVYPGRDIDWRPNAVILVPDTTYHFGLLGSPLIHFPNNAPIMFTSPNMIPHEVLEEILRLSPTGRNLPAKILIAGPISVFAESQLRSKGLTTFRVTGDNPVEGAAEALEFRYRIPPEDMSGMKNIIIVSAEYYGEAVPAAYFAAHMGTPILFSFKNSLPEATRKKLMKYNDRNVYILGGANIISEDVIRSIRGIVKGQVDRIGGTSPYETAVNFSKYHDNKTMFGWNVNEKNGWSFSFGRIDSWGENIASCILAHLGKHTPLLYTEPQRLPEITKDYVLSLNPGESKPPKPPFMHGFILGYFDKISKNAQVDMEKALILHGKPPV